MQDDLKHASDAIAKIASEAIASIERLYGNRNSLDGSKPKPTVEIPKIPDFTDFTDFTDSPEPEDDLVLLKPAKPAKPAKTVKAPTFETVERPPLIDSDLEKMLL